jgi:hypothetical protein
MPFRLLLKDGLVSHFRLTKDGLIGINLSVVWFNLGLSITLAKRALR